MTRKILLWSVRESLYSRNFSRFSLFFKPFFYFFLTSSFHQNPAWLLRRFAVTQVDYLLHEFSFAKLDFLILHAVLFQRIVQNCRIWILIAINEFLHFLLRFFFAEFAWITYRRNCRVPQKFIQIRYYMGYQGRKFRKE